MYGDGEGENMPYALGIETTVVRRPDSVSFFSLPTRPVVCSWQEAPGRTLADWQADDYRAVRAVAAQFADRCAKLIQAQFPVFLAP